MKHALWITVEILVNIYQGLLYAYFISQFLTLKKGVRNKSFYLLCGGGQALLISLFNLFNAFEGFASIVYLTELFVFAIIMLNGNIIKKLFACTIPLFTGFIISFITVYFISIINKMTFYQLGTNMGIPRIVTLVSIQILYFLSFNLILRVFKTSDNRFSFGEWGLLTSIMIISIVLALIIMFISIKTSNVGIQSYLNLSVIVILTLDIMIYYMVNSLNKKNQLEKEVEKLRLQEYYQRHYVSNAKLQYDIIKKFRHDTKNQFLTICELISDGKSDSAYDFSKRNTDKLSKTYSFIHTDNNIVNAIVNSKLSSAVEMGIEVSCISVNSFSGLDDIDLCSILSNTLDNAITSCLNTKTDTPKEISIELKCENNLYYTFIIKNSIDFSVLKTNPSLKTTKTDAKKHGIGTQILKDIAFKYDGRVDYYEEEMMFCCQINMIGTKGSSN